VKHFYCNIFEINTNRGSGLAGSLLNPPLTASTIRAFSLRDIIVSVISAAIAIECQTFEFLLDTLQGVKHFYSNIFEINTDRGSLAINWRSLAGSLLNPPLTASTIRAFSLRDIIVSVTSAASIHTLVQGNHTSRLLMPQALRTHGLTGWLTQRNSKKCKQEIEPIEKKLKQKENHKMATIFVSQTTKPPQPKLTTRNVAQKTKSAY
jgi:hypothetical protein